MRPSFTAPTATGLAALAMLWSTASAVLGAPIVLAGDGLTEETWSRVEKGTWLVEHYSPYCSHCKSFAPKWKELVDTYSAAASSHNFHFAQVDCAANGDLCHAHSVKYYPSIFLYVDGSFKEEFTDRRSVENLGAFVEKNYPVGAEKLEKEKQAEEEEGRREDGAREWERKEERLDEQVGMGEAAAKAVVKGKGKARLPKEGDKGKPDLPVLHVTDEGEGGIDGAATQTDADGPLEELVADAKKDGENDVLYPSDPTSLAGASSASSSTSTQTPPASPTSTVSKFVPAPFVAQQPAVRSEKKREKPDGTVKVLEREEVAGLKENDAEPAFVKYYAPWCGHCKALAPRWKDLAETLSTAVHVYEMDCDAAENKKVCRGEKVQAYPTLIFYNKGASVEYHGKRDVESMKQFALKAMASTTIKPVANEVDLKHAVSADPVVILFLHSSSSSADDVALAQSASKSLLGSTAPVYSSTSPSLFTLFSLPADQPTLLTFKDGSLTPSSTFAIPSSTTGQSPQLRLALAKQYLRTAKLPIVSELNGATYADLMPSAADLVDAEANPPPLVGLAVLSRKGLGPDGFKNAQSLFEGVAGGWTERRRMDGAEGVEGGEKRREVLWAWVDGDKWAGWARTMFDVKEGAKKGPRVVIADPKDLTYYSTTLAGEPLELTSSAVYELIEQGIFTGKAKAESSRNAFERFGASTLALFTTLYTSATAHPILALLTVAASWYLLWKALKKAFASDHGPAAGGYQPVRGPKRE
ncbi:hypothetical protein JCM6882_006638 [Rhodosporidiobolus microsporus]